MIQSIHYISDTIAKYFSKNRTKWTHFYESERAVIQALRPNDKSSILDIGCGCGGLGIALSEKFGVREYVGVEINPLAAQVGREMNTVAQIYTGDLLDLQSTTLKNKYFNIVFSLGCFDWNINFYSMLVAAWKNVLPGGHLVCTLRLTLNQGCNDITKSYQYINYDGEMKGEIAPYVVLNSKRIFDEIRKINPAEVHAHGYYGSPSKTAITKYMEICFCAVSLKKREADSTNSIKYNLLLPKDILDSLDLVG